MEGVGSLYVDGRRRVLEMVVDLGPDQAAEPVPACPEWTVHDVIAHLAGSCADVLAGKTDGVTTAAWADAQVRQRKDRTMKQLLEEWSIAAPQLEAAPDRLPPPLPTLWVLDLTTHEHDVRGAIRRPGARDAPAVLAATEFLVNEGLHRQLVTRGLGPLEIRTSTASWVVGGQLPSAKSMDRPVAGVEAPLFELFRALTGRRSSAQIARFDWTSDPAPFLPAFQFGTFTTRKSDLDE